MRLSANLSMLFGEHPFLDRFEAAARAGFHGVECWFPYAFTIPALQAALRGTDQKLVVINSAPGDEAAGEWGIAALPGREAEFEASAATAITYAQNLGCGAVHVMAGLVGGGDNRLARRTYIANLERALRLAEGTGVTLLIEPLNPRDRPTYLLSSADDAAQIIQQIGSPQLRMMFDIYHVQIAEGDLLTRLGRHLPLIGHVQIASVPGRNEPDDGEVAYAAVLKELNALGWPGWIGCEYRPRGRTEDGLGGTL
jgi:hydroxypyruvate isomerase